MTRASSTNRLFLLKIRPAYWLVLFSGLGFGFRVQELSFQPLWGDEGWSFYLANQPLGQLLNLTALDIHPPLYYIFLKVWLFLTGPGAEEARFLSVIAGTLLIPVVGLLGRRWFNRLAGIMSAAVTALAPLAIYYSQEVRMYGWVTLLGAMSVYFCLKNEALAQAQSPQPARRPVQMAYILSTTAALYTHYYAIFILLFQGLYLLLRHRHTFFRYYLSPFVVTGLLYLPWVIYTGTRLINYIENKRNVEGYLPLDPVRFVGDHLVAFSLGHLSAELQDYGGWSTLPFVLIASLGLVVALLWQPPGSQTEGDKRRHFFLLYLYLAVPLFLGYLINQFYPFTPRFYERTLLLAAPAYWLLLGAGLAWLAKRQPLLTGAIASLMLVLLGVSLFSFYKINRYPDEDYRPLLREIAARATPEDTLLASYQWQMGFYQAYLPPPRPNLFIVPGWGKDWSAAAGGQPRLIEDLETIFARSPRLWFPAYQASGHIWEDEAEEAITELGYPALLQWYSPQTKLIVAGAAQSPLRQGEAANFDQRLSLLEATIGGETYQAGRDIIPIRLLWRKEESLGSEHWVSLRLVDEKGYTWASRDSYPQAGQRFFTDIKPGETLEDRHGLLTPAGAPPGRYRLLLSVRRVEDAHPLDLRDEAGQPLGAELFLADIELILPEPPVGIAALPVQKETRAVFNRQVHLVGYSLAEGPFKAGEALPLTLFWESLVDHPGAFMTWLVLKDGMGETVAPYQQAPLWPASEWQKESLLRDPYALPLPPALLPGQYQLIIALLGEDGQRLAVENADQIVLAEITTVDRPHVFEAPAPQFQFEAMFGGQARLVGLNLPETTVKAGETLPLTLYWQALAPFDRSWKVFVHLTDQAGQIIGQQDQVPGGGEFPTSGWVPNEYLVDRYQLPVPAETQPGSYQLEIGLYDPNDFSRLPVSQGGKAIGDHVTLESWLISIE
jgi:hypothetical protein